MVQQWDKQRREMLPTEGTETLGQFCEFVFQWLLLGYNLGVKSARAPREALNFITD